MCLAVPGRVVNWIERDGVFARALVDFSGVQRECPMACVPDAMEGDYVVVHAGIAISRMDTQEAERAIREWQAAAAAEHSVDERSDL